MSRDISPTLRLSELFHDLFGARDLLLSEPCGKERAVLALAQLQRLRLIALAKQICDDFVVDLQDGHED